jgi:hypothetical protein
VCVCVCVCVCGVLCAHAMCDGVNMCTVCGVCGMHDGMYMCVCDICMFGSIMNV